MKKAIRRLTQREIDAIVEALQSRLAGAIEDELPPREAYESALEKMQGRQRRPR